MPEATYEPPPSPASFSAPPTPDPDTPGGIREIGPDYAPAPEEPRFFSRIEPIPPDLRERMIGISWHPDCPVSLDDLRLVTAAHWGFDSAVHTGRLVLNEDVAEDVVTVLRRLFEARFPIRGMRPVLEYGGDDYASIEDDNTSAFNGRRATGSTRWSEHALGRAIDINPIENPYVSGGRTSHPASVPYLDRSEIRPGMAYEGGALVEAFRSIGWGWGGRWPRVKDYQHFSAGGR